jgi:hypothetical protein
MPLYYAITNRDAANLPLSWSSIKQGNVFSFLEARKNITKKEELSNDDLMDTGLVMQRRFYLPRGKREAIEKITTHNSAQLRQAHQGKTLLSHNPVYHAVVGQGDPVG